jgi:hypothetical protein
MVAVMYLPRWHPALMKSGSWARGYRLLGGDFLDLWPCRVLLHVGTISAPLPPSHLPEGLGKAKQPLGSPH